MSDKNTELMEIMSCGIDRRRRRIYFGLWGDYMQDGDDQGDVSWSSAEMAIRGLHILASDNQKPIELHVYSWGGDVYAMLRLIDEIEACPCQVKFFGGGRIASAMTWIMSVCDERYLHKNTVIMLHDGSTGTEGKHTDVLIDARHDAELQDRLDHIFANNSHMPVEFWQDILQRDVFITPEEAIMLGIADKIIEPKRRGNLRRSRIALMNKGVDQREMRKLVNSLYKRINRKRVNRIEINAPRKEEFDNHVIIEESTPEQHEEFEPLMKKEDE